MSDTIRRLIDPADRAAPAIGAPDRDDLAYADLRALIDRTVSDLNGFGIGRGDAVAIVLPNGPEMATAFLGVACAATAAPLNPAYRPDEFEFYLADLEARAVVVQAGDASPVRDVAARLGLPLIELEPRPDGPAGDFRLRSDLRATPARPGPAQPDDVALVLHTSGTTSRPKIVPLSHRNVCASARHIGETLALGRDDRCLNVMPLFHIHGLIAAVLTSVAAGGSVVCAPGFNALRFFAWLAAAQPSWYTAVPTMHQAILTRAAPQRRRPRRRPPALHPLLLRLPAPLRHGRPRSDLRRARDRVLRHDRGRPPDDLEPAAAATAQARQRRRRGGPRRRHHGRRRRPAARAARPARS